LIVNKQAWETLPRDLQMLVETAAMASNLWMLSEFEARNIDALKSLKEEHKVQVLEFPTEVLAALRTYTSETLTEEAAKDATFEHVYERYQAFMNSHDAWSEISESAYARARKA